VCKWSAGLVNVNTGCCGAGQYNGVLPCVTGIEPCSQRDAYLFWDPFHPTDAVNVQIAQALFSGPSSAISPMNIKQLATA
jgi:phospholipase/lecithinase/hemolysin